MKAFFQFLALRTAVRLNRRWEWALFHLGNAYAEHRSSAEALPYWREAAQAKRPRWAAVSNLAQTLLSLGRPQEALEPVQRFLSIHATHAPAYALLGKIHQRTQPQEALAAFEQSLRLEPRQDALRLLSGVLLERAKEPERALEHYQKIEDPALAPQAAARIAAIQKQRARGSGTS